MFSTLHKTFFKISVTFIFSSAHAFNLDQSKILLSGNELKKNDSIIHACSQRIMNNDILSCYSIHKNFLLYKIMSEAV